MIFLWNWPRPSRSTIDDFSIRNPARQLRQVFYNFSYGPAYNFFLPIPDLTHQFMRVSEFYSSFYIQYFSIAVFAATLSSRYRYVVVRYKGDIIPAGVGCQMEESDMCSSLCFVRYLTDKNLIDGFTTHSFF